MKKIFLSMMFIFCALIILNTKCLANYECEELNNKAFYIKNVRTGHYLSLEEPSPYAGLNVCQKKYTGGDEQKWYIMHFNNNEYGIISFAGATQSDNTLYLNYALDVDCAMNENGTIIHIWNAIANGDSQTFSFTKTIYATYIIETRCSNYSKAVTLSSESCQDYVDIYQWTWDYSLDNRYQWILEPVDSYPEMGVSYAKLNYNNYVNAYPDFTHYGGDCTNFVSQCLLASGMHQRDNWFIRKLNTRYQELHNPEDVGIDMLTYSWEFPKQHTWFGADPFKDEFYSSRKIAVYSGANIVLKHNELWRENIFTGDVIQQVDNVVGIPGKARHTMYITGYGAKDIGEEECMSYNVTYHSNNRKNVSMLDFVYEDQNDNLEDLYVFYDFTN